MILAERRAIPGRVEIGVERHVAQIAGGARRFSVEAHEVTQHCPEAGAHEISRLREEAGQARAGIFQAAVVERNGEGHI